MTHLSPRRRRAVAGALGAVLLLGIAGCARSASDRAQWETGPSTPDMGDFAEPTPPTPTVEQVNNRNQLPKFGPVPVAIPVNIPDGPSAAWLSAIATTQPVAFLTIDDGFTKDPRLIDLLRQSGIRVTLFLEINAIKDNPDYFRQLEAAGAVIEAHTITHPELVGKSYDFQKSEIGGSADWLGKYYGRRPTLFRPPFGDKDATTLRVVHDCGMKAAFFWKETVNAGIVRYQVGSKVKPGDILLMHFRPTVVQDFTAALWAIHDAGLTPALLEDYVTGGAPPLSLDVSTPSPNPSP